jgi:hypothetical protein
MGLNASKRGIVLVDRNDECALLRRNNYQEKRIDVCNFITSKLSNTIPSKDAMAIMAASFAERKMWKTVQSLPREEIRNIYLVLIEESVESSDIIMCSALLGGGVLHIQSDCSIHFIDGL